jgi:ribosomal protein S18 acetylase RimI-like enzyme
MPVAIRRVEGTSAFRRLHRLFVEYQADLPRELRLDRLPDVEELERVYRGEDAAFLAISGRTAIGCVAVTRRDDRTAVLLRLFVAPASRGLGAARSLVAAVISYSRERGYRRIVLDTHKDQLGAAYRLYRSLGFEECEPYAGVTYACPTYMELTLSATTSEE